MAEERHAAEDRNAPTAIENAEKPADGTKHPAAGPHAKQHLTDKEKTPGSGALPSENTPEIDAGPD